MAYSKEKGQHINGNIQKHFDAIINEMTSVRDHISVCICTYKRARLLSNLLEKLEQQLTNDLFTYSVVVVDNDVNESAKTIVESFKQKSSVSVNYFVEPEQNIALARNKAVGNAIGDFIALIDDDEYPEPNWLLNFYKTLIESVAGGVLGPVLPDYPVGVPKWIIKSKIWEMPLRRTGTFLDWQETRTASVLLKRDVFESTNTLFDPQFGLTGGEDDDFFKRMMDVGWHFVWCNEAVAFEIITAERWSRRYYLEKYLRWGGLSGKWARKWPFPLQFRGLVKTTLALSSWSLALAFSCLVGHHLFMKCLLKTLYHFGWFVGFLWRPIVRFR